MQPKPDCPKPDCPEMGHKIKGTPFFLEIKKWCTLHAGKLSLKAGSEFGLLQHWIQYAIQTETYASISWMSFFSGNGIL